MTRALAALLLVLALALPGLAQEAAAPDPGPGETALADEWAALNARAVEVLEAARASPEALESLRAELVRARARFAEAQQVNSARIETLRGQLASLGEPPPEGETEAPELAAQREDLTAQLDELLIPVREAQANFTAADGLIAETDALISEARTEDLLRQDAPPINPVLWPPALRRGGEVLTDLGTDLAEPFATPTERAAWMGRGVQLGILVFAAVLLLWRSRVWLGHLRDRVARHEQESPPARLGLLAISLARAILPVVGLGVVAQILRLLGTGGLWLETAEWLLPAAGLLIFGAHWLSLQAFPERDASVTLLPIPARRRREGRVHAVTLGIVLALSLAVYASDLLADVAGVLQFALMVAAGLTLLRLGQLILAESRQLAAGPEDDSFWLGPLQLLARLMLLVGLVAPVATGLGFVNLGTVLMWSTLLTLALLALIGTLQTAIFDAWAVLTRRREAATDALAPTLVGFALAVAAVPVLALIWGVRPSTLGEWWETFLRGFRLGETQISPGSFLTFIIVFVIGYLITRMVKGVLRRSVLPKTRLDTGGTNAILSGTGYLGITLAALLAITTAGINLGGLAIVAGALSVGVGFGLQTVVQNFVSGIILLIERPIKLGDWINVNGMNGFVRQISVRSTRIETFDRQDVIIPNADLISGVVTNYTLGNSSGRLIIPVGVAYGTDTRRVEAVLREIAEAHPMVVLNPPPVISFEGFGADSLDFQMRVVLRDILFIVATRTELNHAIAERFREEGIEIPFAQRDVWLRNPETLRPAPEA
ncbi:DUF3772 domain-containing protein [Jannaschia ovalis]|uniref:DUF3772 domain-containing protein n=1 Tax=Jannaschia ovalis TaxID=3038773 RepID=A0ABY8LBD6_9RHOB|nr:DUF3772 domain-containing protein [Jannaschia sp. GRR-S6-38]WGH78436.1 DUF3772 domain-containing protein [Jannaschia sp. GRR-S6-38]